MELLRSLERWSAYGGDILACVQVRSQDRTQNQYPLKAWCAEMGNFHW